MWMCDMCFDWRMGTEAAWGCSEDDIHGRRGRCDYDMCAVCVHKYQVREAHILTIIVY